MTSLDMDFENNGWRIHPEGCHRSDNELSRSSRCLPVDLDSTAYRDLVRMSSQGGYLWDPEVTRGRFVLRTTLMPDWNRLPSKEGPGFNGISTISLSRCLRVFSSRRQSGLSVCRAGVFRQLTCDHIMARDRLETHPEHHLLTQCFGSERPLLLDTFGGLREKGGLFMICSDGLTGSI